MVSEPLVICKLLLLLARSPITKVPEVLIVKAPPATNKDEPVLLYPPLPENIRAPFALARDWLVDVQDSVPAVCSHVPVVQSAAAAKLTFIEHTTLLARAVLLKVIILKRVKTGVPVVPIF